MPTYATSTVAAPMPNIENLRKQAKLILRWHRDHYYPVAAEIRSPSKTMLGLRASSVGGVYASSESHVPQSGHLPNHFTCTPPQLLHRN